MKNTSVIISTYTADVSGVCSALYELSGMVVIHDPSGCNSTYNTHDEPRWYDQDSLIFISGLSEIDAIMGSDDKLIEDITRAARQLHPRFIGLVQTPVPMMTGIDFEGIREILADRTGLPVYFFPTNGMHSYIQGVNMALAAVAEHMVDDVAEEKPGDIKNNRIKVNLLGVTPLDFSVGTSLPSVKRLLEEGGFELLSCLAMGDSPKQIARAGEADVNLVVSSAGIDAAKVLNKRFGTPYVAGLPTGAFAGRVMESLRESYKTGENIIAYKISTAKPQSAQSRTRQPEYLIGEAVTAQSLREAIRMEYGLDIQVICCLETPEGLLDDNSIYLPSEEEVKEQLTDARIVIADPMYRPICPENARFIPFPHEAFSGRIYRNQIPDLTKPGNIIYNNKGK